MKTQIRLFCLIALFSVAQGLRAQGTSFTYQGQLQGGDSLVNGNYDFRFRLYTDSLGNNYVTDALVGSVPVSNGLFTAAINFGPGIFTGSNLWMEIDLRPTGSNSYTSLTPLQPITPAPYAIFSESASNFAGTISASQISGSITSSNLSGTYGNALTLNNANNSFSGTFLGNGTGLSNVWHTTGNVGTTAGANFLGTADAQPLELHVNNQRALQIIPDSTTNNSPNFIAGASVNSVGSGVFGATISGGGTFSASGSPGLNEVLGPFNTIGGGFGNTTGSTNFLVYQATVGGGAQNSATGISSTISGGAGNLADNNDAAIAGGFQNRANFRSAIGGGQQNAADGADCVIGGGQGNNIETNVYYSFIGGGFFNDILGNNDEAGAVIAGGGGNIIYPTGIYDPPFGLYDSYSAIGGGLDNAVQYAAPYSVIAGGRDNSIYSYAQLSFIGGGSNNYISTSCSNSVITGGLNNEVSAMFSTVCGGNYNYGEAPYSAIGGGQYCSVEGEWSTVAGGYYNSIQNSSSQSAIGGGDNNTIQPNSGFCVISGGAGNTIDTNAGASDISGGDANTISANANNSVIAGGEENSIQGYGYGILVGDAVGGGFQNLCQADTIGGVIGGGFYNTNAGTFDVVPGGRGNYAGGTASFAGGLGAQALFSGDFVWADDSTDSGGGNPTAFFAATRLNQFRVRAASGADFEVSGSSGLNPSAFYINSTSGNGVALCASQGSSDSTTVFVNTGTGDIIKGFSGGTGGDLVFEVKNNGNVYSSGVELTSDRNAKFHFQPIDATQILDRVSAMPVTEWSYTNDPTSRHVGPMAQDFHAAFNLAGDDDKHISIIDEGGIALAAIQGLNRKVEAQQSELARKDAEIAELKSKMEHVDALDRQVKELREFVQSLSEKSGP